MTESRTARILLRLGAGATLAFIYFPLVVIAIYAFNENISQTWPIETTRRSGSASRGTTRTFATPCCSRSRPRFGATAIALVLGTLAALAVSRSRFFGRETISFLVILPDRAAGNHHRAGAAGDDPERPRARSASASASGRSSSGTRPSASSSSTTTQSRGCGGSQRNLEEASMDLGADTLADVPVRDVPAAAVGAARRRAARVRALLRRGRRDDLHVGRAADAADLDLHELRAPARAARRQRRRALRHRRRRSSRSGSPSE